MVEAKLLPPIQVFLEDPEFARPHSVEHHHQARFDGHAAILELRVVVQHVQTLSPILFGKRNAGALKCFSFAVARPGPAQISAPGAKRGSVFDRRRFLQAMASGDINDIALSVPNQLGRSKGMLPAEIHSADTRPMTRKVTMLASDLCFFDWEDSAGA